MKTLYEWSVQLGTRFVRVVAENRLLASKEAARKLQVTWRQEARNMEIIQGGKVRRKEP